MEPARWTSRSGGQAQDMRHRDIVRVIGAPTVSGGGDQQFLLDNVVPGDDAVLLQQVLTLGKVAGGRLDPWPGWFGKVLGSSGCALSRSTRTFAFQEGSGRSVRQPSGPPFRQGLRHRRCLAALGRVEARSRNLVGMAAVALGIDNWDRSGGTFSSSFSWYSPYATTVMGLLLNQRVAQGLNMMMIFLI